MGLGRKARAAASQAAQRPTGTHLFPEIWTGQPSGGFHPDGTAVLDGLQILAGLETNGLAGRNGNFFPGPGVAADPGLAGLDVEDAESPQLYPIIALKRAFHRIEHGVNGSFGLASGDSGPLDDMVDDV